MAFPTERELVGAVWLSPALQDLLHPETPGQYVWRKELTGLFGIPDVVVTRIPGCQCDGNSPITAAFDMKLSKWKQALTQAFRYRVFAELAYVVIDVAHVQPALKNLERFRRSNVGLVSVDRAGLLTVHHRPTPRKPYTDGLAVACRQKMLAGARGSGRWGAADSHPVG